MVGNGTEAGRRVQIPSISDFTQLHCRRYKRSYIKNRPNVSSRALFYGSIVATGRNRPFYNNDLLCHRDPPSGREAISNHMRNRLLRRPRRQLETLRNDTVFKSNSFLNFAIPKKVKCNFSNEAGYSFLEFVIVIVLIGIIAGVMSTMFVFGVDMFDSSVSRKDTVPGSRIATQFLIKDFRAIADASDIASAATTTCQIAGSSWTPPRRSAWIAPRGDNTNRPETAGTYLDGNREDAAR